jgi:hypothetical protein
MSWLLSNPDRPYLDHSKTDVMKTWKKHGFVPPSENKASEPLKKDDIGQGIPKAITTAQGG